MANRHFANLGDVWKHLLLAEVLRLNPPQHYWETHAGSPTYPLSESPARLHGALRFLAYASSDPDLLGCGYMEALQAQPGIYPGSPAIAVRQLGAKASYLFCETESESVAALRLATLHHDARVVEGDGVVAIAREMARRRVEPGSVLVHIDPYDPRERLSTSAMTPLELAASAARQGYRLFYWYGYDSMRERGWASDAISRLAPGIDVWCGDMLMPAPFIYPERMGPWGCGVVLANMTAIEATTCAQLGVVLERISAGDVATDNEPSCSSFTIISGRSNARAV